MRLVKGCTFVVLVLLSVGMPAARVAAQANPSCPATCDKDKLAPVQNPGASSTDIATAVKVTLDAILGAITSFIPEASGAESLMDTGFSLWTAWDSVANPQNSVKNSLHNDMVHLQDYLVCEMTTIVGQAETDIIKYMNAQQLQQKNAFINNAVSTLTAQCGPLNCLNATNLPPSQRNGASGINCVAPHASSTCKNITWDVNNPQPVACNWVDRSGGSGSGICDPDGQCYSSGTSFNGAQDFYTAATNNFNDPTVNGLFGLDQFAIDDTDVLVLGAKMSLLQINMYQQLIMLGSDKGENGTLKAFATQAANWLEARYNYFVDINRIRDQIGNYSTLTLGRQDALGTVNPVLSGSIVNLQEYGSYATAQCVTRADGAYSDIPPYNALPACFLWNAFYGSYTTAWGCNTAQQQPTYQQTETFCYWKATGQAGIPPPCSHDTLPYGLNPSASNNYVGTCTGDINAFSRGTCRIDNTFPDTWMGSHNTALNSSYVQAKEALAQQLLSQATTTLADVKGAIDDLRQLANIGMPAASLGIFETSYPLQQCNAPVSGTNAAAAAVPSFVPNAAQLLVGDGTLPLPRGVLVEKAAPAPATAAATMGRRLRL